MLVTVFGKCVIVCRKRVVLVVGWCDEMLVMWPYFVGGVGGD